MTNLNDYKDLESDPYGEWRQNRFRLVSLMALLRFNAETFCKVSMLLGQYTAFLQDPCEIGSVEIGWARAALEELGKEAKKLTLRSTLQQVARLKQYIDFHGDLSFSKREFGELLEHLILRITDDLETEFFLSVAFNKAEYYEQKAPLFGDLVAAKFPRLTEDISEAGKCLALTRYTATVFHLMRVMEAGVQEFGNRLGIKVEGENWQVILDRVNKVIKEMKPREDPRAKIYAEAAAHLYNVKVAWRNEVMHPKETYTEEEAEQIFQNVKAFIVDLAQIL